MQPIQIKAPMEISSHGGWLINEGKLSAELLCLLFFGFGFRLGLGLLFLGFWSL